MRNHRTVCWNTREALIAKADFHIFFLQPIHIYYHDIRRPPCGAGPRDTQKAIRLFVGRVPAPLSPPPYYHNKKHWKCSRCPVLLFLFHCFHFWLRAPSERPKEEEKRKRKRKRERERERRERAHCQEQEKQKGKPGRTILCQNTFQLNHFLDKSKPSLVHHIIMKRLS